ncbi:OPT oligopeptide transporter protein-domain-containing protein [Pisolithus croceorrhizus]|nr:OPT oligopeptide transporter protein-domain-containing protein [Pisolithus croceorrhizus]
MVWKGNPPAAKQPRARRAQVRAAVANTDDSSIPAMTLRTWVLALAWAVITPGLNQFMFYRYPPVAISSFVLQLLSFPIGKLWARYIPRKRIFGVSLNPGPFSMKEHVLITMIASVGAQTNIIVVQRVYYNQIYSFSYQWFLVLSTQLIGFSAGGIARRFLVSPPSMIWPPSLITCALFNALHSQLYAGVGQLGGLSRERFFLYAFLCAFVWYFFPGYIFQALSYFSWVTWIWPDNAAVAQLFGRVLSRFSIACPMSLVISSNTWDSLYMPIQSRQVYDNMAQPYNVTRVLTDDVVSDEATYNAYSPLFMTTCFAVSYDLSFAIITATLTPTFLHFDKQIMMQVWRSLGEQPDIHARLMSVYPQVPDWWYLVLFVIMCALGVVSFEAFVVALFIAFTYVIPCGMIQAITNQQVGLKYALPGRLIAMMMFTTWGYTTMTQALTFAADSKLGHCMKIPPRKMFWCQIVAAIVAATTQLGVQTWMFNSIPDMCSQDQKDGFTRPYPEVFGTASIVWGVVGPALQFSSGQRYQALLYFFVVGAIAPVPHSSLRYVNPVFFNGTSLIPPATELNFVPWALVNYIFQNIIRKHNCPWWAKYNYVLSAALDSGLAVSVLVIFFTLQYPMNGMIGMDLQQWWGNFALLHFSPLNNDDGQGVPVLQLATGQTFG